VLEALIQQTSEPFEQSIQHFVTAQEYVQTGTLTRSRGNWSEFAAETTADCQHASSIFEVDRG
jgi:hypothetical protein